MVIFMSNMRLRYRLPLAMIAIMLVVTLTIGSSYAFWKLTKDQSTANIIRTGCFDVKFEEDSNSISLDKAYPVTDAKGLTTAPYTFTLTNTCAMTADYTIYLNVKKLANKIPDNYIKYALTRTGTVVDVTNKSLLSNANKNIDKTLFNTEDTTPPVSDSIETSYMIGGRFNEEEPDSITVTLQKNESVTYHLRLWIDETAIAHDKIDEVTKEVIQEGISGRPFEASIYAIAKSRVS